MKYGIIVIICLVFAFIAEPVDQKIAKRISNKVWRYIVQLLVNILILLCLYGIAAMLGFRYER